jgi:hypothetical protein
MFPLSDLFLTPDFWLIWFFFFRSPAALLTLRMLLADGSYMSTSMYNKPLLSWIIFWHLISTYLDFSFDPLPPLIGPIFQPLCTYTVGEALIWWALKLSSEGFGWHQSRVGQDDRDRSIFNGLIRTIQFAGGARPTWSGCVPLNNNKKTNLGVAPSESKQKTWGGTKKGGISSPKIA